MKSALLSFALILPVVACGQTIWGLKAGLNLAKINASVTIPGIGSFSNSTDNLASFHAGVYAQTRLSDVISIQPELIYSAQGGSTGSGDLKFDFINLPIMFVYHANEKFNLHAGPQIGFLVSATAGGNSVSNDVSSPDFGLGFGIGFEVGSGVNLGFRYNLGLSNLSTGDTQGLLTGGSISTTNTVMQFSVGIRLTKPPSE